LKKLLKAVVIVLSIIQAANAETIVRLSDLTNLTVPERECSDCGEDIFFWPKWSADCKSVAFVSNGSTYVYDQENKSVSKVLYEKAGFGYIWSDDNRSLIYRKNVHTGTTMKIADTRSGLTKDFYTSKSNLSRPRSNFNDGFLFRDEASNKKIVVAKSDKSPLANFAYSENSEIWLETADARTKIAGNTTKNYFVAEISPDGSRVLYQEIVEGLFIYEIATGKNVKIGRADEFCWSPDGKFVLFTITKDDGSVVSESDLFLADCSGNITALEKTSDLIEMTPDWNKNDQITFESAGKIYTAKIILEVK